MIIKQILQIINYGILFLVVLSMLILTGCAGQQSARQLAGLEMVTMLEYKQAINQSVFQETDYYKKASEQLENNFRKMNQIVVSHDALDRRAMQYSELWHKNIPSEYNILIFIDGVYLDFKKVNKEYEDFVGKIDEQYFSKIEKLNVQHDNLDKSIAALKQLYVGEEFSEQTNLLKDYLVKTIKTIDNLKQKKNGAKE